MTFNRYQTIEKIMMTPGLTTAEYRICFYLIMIRANAQTGICCVSDARIAQDLNFNKTTIEKTKAALKARGLITWTSHKQNGRNTPSVYSFELSTQSTIPAHTRVSKQQTIPAATRVPHTRVNGELIPAATRDKHCKNNTVRKNGHPRPQAGDTQNQQQPTSLDLERALRRLNNGVTSGGQQPAEPSPTGDQQRNEFQSFLQTLRRDQRPH